LNADVLKADRTPLGAFAKNLMLLRLIVCQRWNGRFLLCWPVTQRVTVQPREQYRPVPLSVAVRGMRCLNFGPTCAGGPVWRTFAKNLASYVLLH
jgi:hypothetical protein